MGYARKSVTELVNEVLDSINADELAKLAVDLGNVYSPAGSEAAVGEFLVDWLRKNGFEPEKIGISDERFNVVARIKGDGTGQSLLFNSHMDAIMSREDRWMFKDPSKRIYHEAWEENRRIMGVPVVNDRGPMSCFLIAAKAIKESREKLKGDLILTMVAGEIDLAPVDEYQDIRYRSHDVGAKYLVDHGVHADYALVAEATNFRLGWVEAGMLFLKITVFSEQSYYTPYVKHPDKFEKAPNAIVRMAKLIERLEEWAGRYETGYSREFSSGVMVPKANIGAIRGGEPWKIFRSPELCSIYMDIRLTPECDPQQIENEISDVIRELGLEAKVEPFAYYRGYEAKNVEPLVEAVSTAHNRIFNSPPDKPAPPENSMWRDINPFLEVGIPAAHYGPGSGAGGGAFFFNKEDMVKAAKVYALTALDICKRNRFVNK